MTPGEFIAKWQASELKERSAAQSHFNDLCQLLDEPTPTESDPTGDRYCFERGARKDTGGDKIMRIIKPVVIRPWLAEWEAAKAEIEACLERAKLAKSGAARTR